MGIEFHSEQMAARLGRFITGGEAEITAGAIERNCNFGSDEEGQSRSAVPRSIESRSRSSSGNFESELGAERTASSSVHEEWNGVRIDKTGSEVLCISFLGSSWIRSEPHLATMIRSSSRFGAIEGEVIEDSSVGKVEPF